MNFQKIVGCGLLACVWGSCSVIVPQRTPPGVSVDLVPKGRHNAIGYVGWHFTLDDHSIYQSLPTNERGEHADYDGPGNRSSIGIEMCENRGNDRARTLDKTARLTAWLLNEHGIPTSHVVPHMHWRMIRHDDRRDLGHKLCPHFLLDRGRLGPKWQAFIAKVEAYRRAM